MAINWGTIGNIEPPKVLGSIPASGGGGGPSPLDSLAGGIMQGVGMADQMKTNAMAREQTQMQMDQSKQLFPAQLSAAQDQARVSKAAAAKAEREDEGIKTYRATIQQGYDKAMQAMQQVDPVGAIKMQQDLEDLRNKQGMAVESLAKGTKAQAEALDTIQAKAGQIASETVAMATDQQSGQIDWNKANAIYKQRLAPFTKSNPELTNSIFPAEFNQQSFLNMTYLGQQALANQQAALLSKQAPTNEVQNSKALAELEQQEADGTITPVGKKQLDNLRTLTAKTDNGTGLQQNQEYIDSLQAQYAKLKNKQTPAAQRLKQKIDEAQGKINKETQPGLVSGLVDKAASVLGFGNNNNAVPEQAQPTLEEIQAEMKRRGIQ